MKISKEFSEIKKKIKISRKFWKMEKKILNFLFFILFKSKNQILAFEYLIINKKPGFFSDGN